MARGGAEYMLARGLSISRGGSASIMQRVAIAGVAVSVAVMIVAVVVIAGFKREITSKVEAFVSHYEVVSERNSDSEHVGVSKDEPFIGELLESGIVKSISPFALKAGVMSHEDAIEGVMLKGVDSLYNLDFFGDYMVEGALPRLSGERAKEVLISRTMARRMEVGVGDRLRMMFMDRPIRRDIFTISGIYDTSLAEFDKMMAIVDIRDIQRLNGWKSDEVGGFELTTDSFDGRRDKTLAIEEIVYGSESSDAPLLVENMRERYTAIFEWLDIQDLNIAIITVIMLVVAIFNVVAMMLILLIERTSTIGILKSIGMTNMALQRLFILRMIPIVAKGLLWANVVALLFCYIQKVTGLITISGEGYYLTTVPIHFDWGMIVLINLITVVAVLLSQVIPTLVISRISPHKAVKYE